MLEQRLKAIEEKLQLSVTEKRDGRDMNTATSSTIQKERESPPSPRMKGPLDEDDEVDGMGAVALKDGADEEEYFGTVLFTSYSSEHFMNPLLTM